MAALVGKIILDTKALDALSRNLGVSTGRVIAATAKQVEAMTKANIVVKDIWDTGNLHNSIMAEEISDTTWHVSDGTEYGIHIELGTNKKAARTFLTPAVETVSNQVADIVKREMFQ